MDLQLDVAADHGPSQFPITLPLGALGTPSGDFAAADAPVPIPDNSAAGADSVIPIGETFDVADLDVAVTISHARISDLEVDLLSPLGTVVRLHDRTGGDTADIDTVYDTLTVPDGPGALGDFIGEPVAGDWTLRVADRRNMIAGEITAFSLNLQGAPAVLCEPVPCKVGAAITAGPSPVCGGEPVTVSGIGSLFAGEDCGGTLEYRLEGNAGVLQDWSPDPDVVDFPDQDQIYTVQARDPLTGALSLASTEVTASPTPVPAISQSPTPVCSEVGDAVLDAGDGFAAYTWRDGGGQIVGTERMLALSGDACLQSLTLSVSTTAGCSGETGSFAAACAPCTPGEVSPPGSPVPFRLGVDAAATLEFGLLPDPDVEYNLIVADSVGAILSGDYTHRYCDLESNSVGTWSPVDAGTVRWTPLVPDLLVEGMWVVFAERTNTQGVFPGPYGAGSDGMPRPADTDGQGSIVNVDCP
jgi:subtilisin-like proprotein convertase family protein